MKIGMWLTVDQLTILFGGDWIDDTSLTKVADLFSQQGKEQALSKHSASSKRYSISLKLQLK